MGARDTLPRALAGTHEMTKAELQSALTAERAKAAALMAQNAHFAKVLGWGDMVSKDPAALAAAIEAVLREDEIGGERWNMGPVLDALRLAWQSATGREGE